MLIQVTRHRRNAPEMTKVANGGSKTYMWEQKTRTLNFKVFLRPQRSIFCTNEKSKSSQSENFHLPFLTTWQNPASLVGTNGKIIKK